jgi:hypothetical protein
MTKYARRTALTTNQGLEIFPILDMALNLPFGKAVLHPCPTTRAEYLARILNGERYRNAVESLSTYLEENPFYGKGLYYNLVIEPRKNGLLVANVENPPHTLTWYIIECAATKKPVVVPYPAHTVQARLNKLRARHQEISPVYYKHAEKTLHYAIPSLEQMVIVDIDIEGSSTVPPPSPEDRAKIHS